MRGSSCAAAACANRGCWQAQPGEPLRRLARRQPSPRALQRAERLAQLRSSFLLLLLLLRKRRRRGQHGQKGRHLRLLWGPRLSLLQRRLLAVEAGAVCRIRGRQQCARLWQRRKLRSSSLPGQLRPMRPDLPCKPARRGADPRRGAVQHGEHAALHRRRTCAATRGGAAGAHRQAVRRRRARRREDALQEVCGMCGDTDYGGAQRRRPHSTAGGVEV
eukprot:299472-Chlamydomonas_euryale.AAC.1